MDKIKHLLYVPFTGLGLYGGFRGDEWFNNRLNIFKQFVVPSLQNQTNKNFTLWISFTEKQRNDKRITELENYLKEAGIKTIITYSGICFYDDKYQDPEATERLYYSIKRAKHTLIKEIKDADYILMTIQPSDDLYDNNAVNIIQEETKEYEGVGFKHGYVCNYITKEVAEYNSTTNPPFYTIKFKRNDFTDPERHLKYTGLKYQVGKYEKGTPLPSHEYVKDCIKYKQIDYRGFLVGTHGVNISTHWNIPFKGKQVSQDILSSFGIQDVPPLKVKISLMKKIVLLLPHKVQKKIRYLLGKL